MMTLPSEARSGLPVAVGFGVRTPERAATIAQTADAVVVGSALVEIIEAHRHDPCRVMDETIAFTRRLADSIKTARSERVSR